jgi:hypothetical protein
MCEGLFHSGAFSIADLIVYGWALFSATWVITLFVWAIALFV